MKRNCRKSLAIGPAYETRQTGFVWSCYLKKGHHPASGHHLSLRRGAGTFSKWFDAEREFLGMFAKMKNSRFFTFSSRFLYETIPNSAHSNRDHSTSNFEVDAQVVGSVVRRQCHSFSLLHFVSRVVTSLFARAEDEGSCSRGLQPT